MSWLSEYVATIDPISEAPMAYNLWAGVSVLSAVLKKNIWLNYKTFTVYPNQYIVLVGPPGVGKGEAIHPAHGLTKDHGLVNYLSDRITAPRIIERLFQGFTSQIKVTNGKVTSGAKDSSATLMSTELPTLLTSSDWMLQFLCDAWDRNKFEYDTKNKGSHLITDMCTSLMGACTPDYIRKLNKDSMATVQSGFSARTLFIYAEEKSKSLNWGINLQTSPDTLKALDKLALDLVALSNMSGEMTLDSFAQAEWNKFKNLLTTDESDSEAYKNFRSRQHIHVLKLAMTLAASETHSYVITRQVLLKAIAMVESVAEGVDLIFRGVGESDLSAVTARLQTYIEKRGNVTYNQLIKDNMRYMNSAQITQVIDVLKLIGFITVASVGLQQHISYAGTPILKSKMNGVIP